MMARRLISVLFFLLATSSAADTVIPINTSTELVNLLSNSGPNSVDDGAIIELAAGTYNAPSGGFLIFNPDRSFTIRAATPGTVFLSGAGSQRIFRFIVDNAALSGAVVFEGLIFRNGFSTQQAFGSAITLQGADASFIDCLFEDNVNQSNGNGSGTIGIQVGSTALFLRTIVQDNTSRTSGAGAVIVNNSTLWCHQCEFLRNRNNVPSHSSTATGAGMVVGGESSAFLSNSRFAGNEAGFAGGAFDAKGSFTETNPALVIAANSTFVDNIAMPHPSVATGSPTVAGVGNVEDNAIAQFYNSRLIDNSAQFGGALASYRATIEIFDSVLRGNFATGRQSSTSAPRGGAIFAVSDDTAADGNNNHPTSQVMIRDSLFHGLLTSARRGSQVGAAQTGGCVYVSGDVGRVLDGGNQAENSALLDIENTAFVDCNVENVILDNAFGGGVFSALTVVNITGSLFTDGDAIGTGGAGGAITLNRYADATFTDTTFANNSSADRGGALFMLGAKIDINGCTFFKNAVAGTTPDSSRGAAIFTSPQDGAGLGIEGVVRNSLFTENDGLTIHEVDRTNGTGVYNEVTYEANQFFGNLFDPLIYRNTLVGNFDVAGVNNLVVNRGGGNTTDKAPLNNNVTLTQQPIVGALLAVPSKIIDQTAAGDTANSTEASLAYAWCGACAELDGSGQTANTGLTTANTGVHSLMVFDNATCNGAPDLDLTANITQAPTPRATLSADPDIISSGGTSTLTWGTPGGTFLHSALDQGEGVLGTASGSVLVRPSLTTTYTYFAITEEGGDSAQEKIYVDEEPDQQLIFRDSFESGDTSAWN